jgi:hypothetical protein
MNRIVVEALLLDRCPLQYADDPSQGTVHTYTPPHYSDVEASLVYY